MTSDKCAVCGAILYFAYEIADGRCDACTHDPSTFANVGDDITDYPHYAISYDDPEFNEAEEGYIIA
jgi:hypothetical protein